MPMGRLKPGVTVEQAQAELGALFRHVPEKKPGENKDWSVSVVPLHEWSVGGTRSTFYLLLGAVGFILLIACANVANLLLVRASGRRREFAVRVAVGARRARLVRQLLTESLALALPGGVAGILVAVVGIRLVMALSPDWFGFGGIRIDGTVLLFALAVSVVTGLLFGLLPAVQAARTDLNESLKEAGGRSSGGSRGRGRSVLVVAEIALSLVLLVGAGLMINSFVRLSRVDLGYDPGRLLKAEVFLGGQRYWYPIGGDMKRVTPQGDLFLSRMVERAEGLPGVVSAAIGSMEGVSPHTFRVAGKPESPPGSQSRVAFSEVSPGFFRTLGIGLLRGRLLSEQDVEGAPWVVVVSEGFVRRYFPKEDPMRKVLYFTVPSYGANNDIREDHPREIVGVVRDVRYWGPRFQPPPVVYSSFRQHPWEYPGGSYSFHYWTRLLLRTSGPPGALARPVEHMVAEIDKDQVPFNIVPMERRLAEFTSFQRFWMQLFGIFGGLAVLLAMVGIYGVMAYSVTRRTHEIGVRMANGAQPGDILRLVLRQGLVLALAGVGIGLAASFGLTRLVRRYLYGVEPTDPATFAAVALILILVALGASYIPARRAARVDPMTALRYE